MTAPRAVPCVRFLDFLPAAEAERVLRDLTDRRAEFLERGRNGSAGPAFYRMARPLDPWPEFVRRFENVKSLLQEQFAADLKGAQIELLAQAYNHGGSFGRHSDAHAGGPNWRRRLSGAYYLHARPKSFEGGGLALYDRQRRVVVAPDHNSAVFFPRDREHEVLPVTCPSRAFAASRFGINVWIG